MNAGIRQLLYAVLVILSGQVQYKPYVVWPDIHLIVKRLMEYLVGSNHA